MIGGALMSSRQSSVIQKALTMISSLDFQYTLATMTIDLIKKESWSTHTMNFSRMIVDTETVALTLIGETGGMFVGIG